MTIKQVAALPDDAFETRRTPLNEGYTRHAYWVRVATPALAHKRACRQRCAGVDHAHLSGQGHALPAGARPVAGQESGDTVPMAQRIHVRQLVFPLRAGPTPFVLRIETSSAMQLYATVWRSTGLMAWLSSVEWASGVHRCEPGC
ncbi:Interphotoreceptor matrix proteoglycan 2 [Manis javanica]|nr:Interphotoreceptor matrix proteoglycan 2 [Manis javanica]